MSVSWRLFACVELRGLTSSQNVSSVGVGRFAGNVRNGVSVSDLCRDEAVERQLCQLGRFGRHARNEGLILAASMVCIQHYNR